MRIFVPLVIASLMTASAYAQGAGGQGMGGSGQGMGGGGRKHHGNTDKSAVQKPKVDDKAYNAALKTLPDKQFDPWHGMR